MNTTKKPHKPYPPRAFVVHTIETLLARCEEVGDCLEWQGGYAGNGHPVVRHNKQNVLARRLAYTLAGHVIKPGHILAMKCNNPRCIDPAHVMQRTEKQHMAHMGRQGRQSDHLRSAKIAATKRASGQAKLTEQQVREIRASQKTNRQLAAEYGINPSRINGIRLGRMWKDFSNPFAGLIKG